MMPTYENTPAYTPLSTSEETTSSRMVPEEVRKILSALAQQATTEPRPATFVGKLYNPRRQKAQGRDQWREDIYESLRRAKIPAIELTTPPPTWQSVQLRYSTSDYEQLDLAFQTELAHFQAINMRMWDVVRGSLDLTGAFEKTDRDYFRKTFMNGDLRDAHGAFMWADAFGDMKGIKSQVKVNKDLADFTKLSATALQDDIITHATALLELWLEGNTNTEDNPSGYYSCVCAPS